VELSPFYGIEKGAVLQESRLFNDPQIDVRRCQQIITKLLYLINHGDYFTKVRSSLRCAIVQAGHTPWSLPSRSTW
jgi:coatomer protein complex subunit gamma